MGRVWLRRLPIFGVFLVVFFGVGVSAVQAAGLAKYCTQQNPSSDFCKAITVCDPQSDCSEKQEYVDAYCAVFDRQYDTAFDDCSWLPVVGSWIKEDVSPAKQLARFDNVLREATNPQRVAALVNKMGHPDLFNNVQQLLQIALGGALQRNPSSATEQALQQSIKLAMAVFKKSETLDELASQVEEILSLSPDNAKIAASVAEAQIKRFLPNVERLSGEETLSFHQLVLSLGGSYPSTFSCKIKSGGKLAFVEGQSLVNPAEEWDRMQALAKSDLSERRQKYGSDEDLQKLIAIAERIGEARRNLSGPLGDFAKMKFDRLEQYSVAANRELEARATWDEAKKVASALTSYFSTYAATGVSYAFCNFKGFAQLAKAYHSLSQAEGNLQALAKQMQAYVRRKPDGSVCTGILEGRDVTKVLSNALKRWEETLSKIDTMLASITEALRPQALTNAGEKVASVLRPRTTLSFASDVSGLAPEVRATLLHKLEAARQQWDELNQQKQWVEQLLNAGGTLERCQSDAAVGTGSAGGGAGGTGGTGASSVRVPPRSYQTGGIVACFSGYDMCSYLEQTGTVPQCGLCELLQLAQRIINFIIYLAILGAAIALVYAGVLYVASPANPGNIQRAHRIFWTVLVGLFVTLGAWIIVNTVMVILAGQSITEGVAIFCKQDPAEVEKLKKACGQQLSGGSSGGTAVASSSSASNSGDTTERGFLANDPRSVDGATIAAAKAEVLGFASSLEQACRTHSANNGPLGNACSTYRHYKEFLPASSSPLYQSAKQAIEEEALVRAYLAERGIKVNKDPCFAKTTGGCTDVRHLKKGVIDHIAAVWGKFKENRSAAPSLVLTGGSELGNGHTCNLAGAAHCTGKKVDIGYNSNQDFVDWTLEEAPGNSDNSFQFTKLDRRRRNDGAELYEVTVNGQVGCWAYEKRGGTAHWDIKLGQCP